MSEIEQRAVALGLVGDWLSTWHDVRPAASGAGVDLAAGLRQRSAAPGAEPSSSRPPHHLEALDHLALVTEQAELYTRLGACLADLCRAMDIRDTDAVMGRCRSERDGERAALLPRWPIGWWWINSRR